MRISIGLHYPCLDKLLLSYALLESRKTEEE